MTARLISVETRRLVVRGRFWVMVGVTAALGVFNLLDREALDSLRFSGSFAMAGGLAFQGMAPLVAGVVSAGALAEDRSRGFPALLMSRGLSRRSYLAGKAVAMALAAGAATLVACLMILLAGALLLPGGETAAPHPPGPIPSLFAAQPLLNDLVAIGFLVLATAGLATSGVLVGALVSNEYLAAAVPLAITIALLFLLSGSATVVSPFTYLDLGSEYVTVLPDSLLPVGGVSYWVCFTLAAVVAGALAARWRELQ